MRSSQEPASPLPAVSRPEPGPTALHAHLGWVSFATALNFAILRLNV